MIKAIVFDFDGTILDTETPDYLTWRKIFREHGTDLPLEAWIGHVGGGTRPFDAYRYLESCIGRPVDREAVKERKLHLLGRRLQTQPLRPGVMAYLQAAREMGLRIGLASSSAREWVQTHLERRGLVSFFEVVRTRDDVKRIKPDPELYRAVTKAVGVEPEETVAIEDSRNGLLAAKAAGLYCVVSPCELTRGLDFKEADLLLPSLSEVALPALLQRLKPTVA